MTDNHDHEPAGEHDEISRACWRLHLRFGWLSLVVFVTLGLALETMHAFKLGLYLNVGNEARRLMWTLAHAHGALLSLLNVVFGLMVLQLPQWRGGTLLLGSRCLLAATILLPLGFLVGGLFIYDGDPGLGVWLVPPGGFLLFLAVVVTAVGICRSLTDRHES